MLSMCKPIFGTGKAVVFYSGFFVSKSITNIEAKVVYAGYLINNRCYCLKEVPMCVACEKFIVKHYDGMCNPIKTKQKKRNKNIKSSTVRNISDAIKFPGSILDFPIVYYYYMYDFNIINFRW